MDCQRSLVDSFINQDMDHAETGWRLRRKSRITPHRAGGGKTSGLLSISDHAHIFEPDVSFHRFHLSEIE